MKESLKVYIAGHQGLVGSALLHALKARGHQNVVVRTHAELDLCDREKTRRFFSRERPDWVLLAAARVGGIYGNSTYPTEFLLENLSIQNNVLEAARDFSVQKLLFFGSSCIYPKNCPQPIVEEALLTSPLEPTNEGYALAKIAGIKLCLAMNRQYGTNFMCVMPCNLYGPNDNYHTQNAHVLPMLLQRFHQARMRGESEVVVWGSGKPMREFLFSHDLAELSLTLMEEYGVADMGGILNIGTGEECSIAELAAMIKEVVGFEGRIVYDTDKPNGTMRKVLDVGKMKSFGLRAKTKLSDGLVQVYRDFLGNPHLRR